MRQFLRRRKVERTSVTWPAVILSGSNRMPCAIIDVSAAGAKIELPSDLPDKSYVIVDCRIFGSLEGFVVWRKGRYVGIMFTEPGAAATLNPFIKGGASAGVTATVKFGRRRHS